MSLAKPDPLGAAKSTDRPQKRTELFKMLGPLRYSPRYIDHERQENSQMIVIAESRFAL